MAFYASPHALLAFAVLALAHLCASTGTHITAIAKVIQLLTDMQAHGQEMKHEEEVGFAKFKQFCVDTSASKEADIKKGSELMESLSAHIEKLDSDISALETKIDDLQTSIATHEADLKKATKEAKKEEASNTQQIQDFAESVDALERAIATLQKQSFDRGQASAALMQLKAKAAIPEAVQRTVAAFVEMRSGDDYITRDAPEANAYEFQSTGIVDMLKKLRDEFTEKRSEAEKEMMNSKHAFGMMSQDLHDAIEGATADVADKTADLQAKKELIAGQKKELALTTKDHDDDVAYLKDLRAECNDKSKSFKEKQSLRVEELEAISKAIEILRSPDVMGAAETHLPGAALVQNTATALAQLRGGAGAAPADGRRREIAGFLRSAGYRLRSKRLGMLAEKVSNSAGPFVKVKKMIEDLINRLLQEAGEESEHKGWCDAELGTNSQTRTKLQDSIDGLTARIDGGESTIMELTERLAELSKETSELEATRKESTELRVAESAKNKKTTTDAAQAQKAIQMATGILKEFYAAASSATALLQASAQRDPRKGKKFWGEKEPVKMGSDEWKSLADPKAGEVDRGHKAGMQTFGDTYTGQQAEAGGVLAMLEVLSSDFAELEADTRTSEAAASSTHKDFLAETKTSLAVKAKEISMLTADKTQAQAELSTNKNDLSATQDQLLAANRYYEKLKPTCVDQGMSYDQRAKARQEEIKSLQEALRILSGEELA